MPSKVGQETHLELRIVFVDEDTLSPEDANRIKIHSEILGRCIGESLTKYTEAKTTETKKPAKLQLQPA